MNFKSLTALSAKFIYKLNYRLLMHNNAFSIHIQADSYDRKNFLSFKRTPPVCTEKNFVELSHFTQEQANDLFSQMIKCQVFPVSLNYIIEDLGVGAVKNNYTITENPISSRFEADNDSPAKAVYDN